MVPKSIRRLCLVLLASGSLASVAAAQYAPAREDPGTALTRHLKTLSDQPRSLYALNGAGQSALALGDAQAALTFFARAEEVAPRDGRIKAGMGSAFLALEQPQPAMRFFNEAAALGLPASEYAKDRGLAYDLAGDPRRAQADYRLALTRGDDMETRRRLALSLGISGDKAEALQIADDLIRRGDKSAWRMRAFVLALTGDAAGATAAKQAVMPGQSQSMAPFFNALPHLSAAQRAQAVHFGQFPAHVDPAMYAQAAPPVTAPIQTAQVAARSDRRASTRRPSRRQREREARRALAETRTARQPVREAVRAPAAAVTAEVTPPAAAPIQQPTQLARNYAVPAGRYGPGYAPTPVAAVPVRAPDPMSRATTLAPSTIVSRPPVQSQPQVRPQVRSQPRAAPAPLVGAIDVITPPGSTASSIERAPVAVTTPATPTSQSMAIVSTRPPLTLLPGPPAQTAIAPPLRITPHAANGAPSAEPVVTPPGPTRTEPVSLLPQQEITPPAAATTTIASTLSPTPAPKPVAPPARVPFGPPTPGSPPSFASLSSSARPGFASLLESASETRAPAALTEAPAKAAVKPEPKAAKSAQAKPAKPVSKPAESKPVAKTAEAKTPPAKPKAASRIWVQVAGGADKSALPREFNRLKQKAPKLLGSRTAWTTPLRFTNRLLVGPFKSESEAQAFVNELTKLELTGFSWTSPAGQEIEKLAAK